MDLVLGQAPAIAAASSAAEAAESASSAAAAATAAAAGAASAGVSAASAAASASSASASASASAPKTRLIATGAGLAGGGDLTADRTLSIAPSGVGTAQLANDAASNAKLADMPANTIKGNNAGATADPKDLTVAEVKSLLNLAGTNSGDQTIALTGDVAGSGTGSFAATIAANAVSNAKLADMPANRIKGNNSGASADPAEVGAMLPAMAGDAGSGGAKGLVPAPAAGDAGKFLRGDGSWSAVAGAGWTLARITVISASTTWTKPPALKAVLARAVGGGGGGGHGVSGGVGGAGGGGGGYSEKLILAASLGLSETVTVGAGGSGGTSGAGGAGGSTSFGAHLSATGGGGGAGGGSTAVGGLGGTGSGGTLNVEGGAGGPGYAIPLFDGTVFALAGDGGWAANGLGPGARTVVTGVVGNAGKNYGGGGGGGLGTVSVGRNGGAGAPGAVILYEFE